jgi:hypothetical protein
MSVGNIIFIIFSYHTPHAQAANMLSVRVEECRVGGKKH